MKLLTGAGARWGSTYLFAHEDDPEELREQLAGPRLVTLVLFLVAMEALFIIGALRLATVLRGPEPVAPRMTSAVPGGHLR